MKKLFYSFGALLLTLLLSSCGDNLGKLESLIDDMKENGKSWDAEQWESFIRENVEVELAFWESEPSKDDIKKYDKLSEKAQKALMKLAGSSKVEKAITKAYKALSKDKDFEKLEKKSSKAEKAARKAASKKSKKDDDDDDDDDDDSDDDDYDDDDDDLDY